MTTNFSFKRIAQLIGKHWAENRRMYWMSSLALLGLLGIVFFIWAVTGSSNYNEEIPYMMGLVGLFITGMIFASTAFSMLGARDKGVYWISFPANHLEKFLTVLFFNLIVFTVVYLLCFSLLKMLADSYIMGLIDKYPGRYSYKRIDWQRDHFSELILNTMCVFFVAQAIFLLGSVAFKRFSFVITAVFVVTLLFVFIYYSAKMMRIAFPDYSFNLFSLRDYGEGNLDYKEYVASPVIKESILFFLKFLMAPILWCITWMKLKEKQI